MADMILSELNEGVLLLKLNRGPVSSAAFHVEPT